MWGGGEGGGSWTVAISGHLKCFDVMSKSKDIDKSERTSMRHKYPALWQKCLVNIISYDKY